MKLKNLSYKISLLFGLFLSLYSITNAQEKLESKPNQTFSRSYVFTGQLNRTIPYVALDGTAVQEVQNMIRTAPGAPVGWKTRQGYSQHNSTALGAYQVKSLHQFVNKDLGVL